MINCARYLVRLRSALLRFVTCTVYAADAQRFISTGCQTFAPSPTEEVSPTVHSSNASQSPWVSRRGIMHHVSLIFHLTCSRRLT